MNMASLMFLDIPCDSLWTMVKQAGCPVELLCWCLGDGALRCSLSLSPNTPRLSNVLFRTVYVWAFECVDNPTLLKFVVLVLGCNEKCFYGVCTFEMYLYFLVVACPFEFLSQPCIDGTTMEYSCCCLFHCCCGCCWADCLWNLVQWWCSACIQNFVVVCWEHMLESGKTAGLSLCGQVPCVMIVGCWILLLPCVPMCLKHCVLLWWNGCCPSVDINLCMWAFRRLQWWGCCWALV